MRTPARKIATVATVLAGCASGAVATVPGGPSEEPGTDAGTRDHVSSDAADSVDAGVDTRPWVRPGATTVVANEQPYTDARPVTVAPNHAFEVPSFGWSVALDGTRLIAGTGVPGQAYVFSGSEGSWDEEAFLGADAATNGSSVGSTVALSGDWAFVGGPGVFVTAYRRGPAGWQLAHEVDDFGGGVLGPEIAVAFDGNHLVLGARSPKEHCSFARAQVRELVGDMWMNPTELVPAGGVYGDPTWNPCTYGAAVAISGSAVAVAEPSGPITLVHVFRASPGTWTEEAVLAADLDTTEQGASVAIDGDTIVVGAPYDSSRAAASGSAFVFSRHGGHWRGDARLVPPDAADHTYFGWSVTTRGGVIVVGAPTSTLATGGVDLDKTGRVYMFSFDGTTVRAKGAFGTDEVGWHSFGRAVAMSLTTVAAGRPGPANGTLRLYPLAHWHAAALASPASPTMKP